MSRDPYVGNLKFFFGFRSGPGDSHKSSGHCAALELPAPGAMAAVRGGEGGGRGFGAPLTPGAL